ncbi:butyrophilin subfamily 1 member A1-like [Suncus etruscus]|uniref:butyrophilin subfamily 1 member A1-like n=1 Tax=Suncus etruscus TaxID=109475 RepID=UPI00210F6B75|nr:butyrophilin subfamily 1 member A1-like [Suncus etruscus]
MLALKTYLSEKSKQMKKLRQVIRYMDREWKIPEHSDSVLETFTCLTTLNRKWGFPVLSPSEAQSSGGPALPVDPGCLLPSVSPQPKEMEHHSSCPVPCSLIFVLLLLQLTTAGSVGTQTFTSMSVFVSTEEFLVIGPSNPITAVVGGNITLPCHVSPAMNAENMELRWFRSKFSKAVFIYRNQQEEMEEQMTQYRGRTSMEKDLLSQGVGVVSIHKIQVSDAGQYTCFFRKEGFSKQAVLELKVACVNFAPQVHITGPEEDGIRVVCRASGWFPRPQVQWRDSSGEKFLAFSETQTQDAEGLFSVEAALVVRDSAVGNVTCSILNPILGQEKAVDIYIPAWRKAHLYADWRKDQFQTCSVTLDPASASPDIVLSHENKSLTLKDTSAYSDLRYNILGHEGITSGRCCWEVEIKNGDKSIWALGVCMEDVKRTGFYTESPQKGFWVIGHNEDGYVAFADQGQFLFPRQVIQRLGVFLDYEEGDVSFYDMTDGSHIFSFPQASFSGTLFPYFMIKSGNVFLTICSVDGGSEHPVPHNSDPSWEEPVNPLGEGFSPDSVVAEAPSGPESPLLSHNSDNMLPSSREEPMRILEEGFSPDTSVDNAP